MLCLRCSRGFGTLPNPTVMLRAVQKLASPASSTRTFTSITPLRPTISPSAFRPLLQTSTPVCGSSTEVLDLMPKISSHPALGSLQIRCGPRRTFDPSHFVRKRRHGFLSRIRTRKGRMILQRRKAKGRSTLSH